MATLQEALDQLISKGGRTVAQQVLDLVRGCQQDQVAFLKDWGNQLEAAVVQQATAPMTQAEFKDLVADIVSLGKIDQAKLSVQVKARAEQIADSVRKLVIDTLCTLIK